MSRRLVWSGERFRRRAATLLVSLFTGTTLLPSGLALAEPQMFSSPTPGVSNLPLQVTAFADPHFGDIGDAVNVATGNVYFDLGQLNRNNLRSPVDMSVVPTSGGTPPPSGGGGTAPPKGGGTTCKPTQPNCNTTQPVAPVTNSTGTSSSRMAASSAATTSAASTTTTDGQYFHVTGLTRLNGFSSATFNQPSEWSMSLGDGSYAYYRQATATEISNAPTWINERYASIQGSVAYYITRPVAGLQTDEKWLVTYQRSDGRTVAHAYDRDGTRTTFLGDGEYADYTQDLSQQYRSAKYNSDPDGVAAASPKTEFTYTAQGNGHLRKIRDEWGRATTYVWNDSLGRIDAVNILLQNENDDSTWVRRVEYAYATYDGQQHVIGMGFRTYDSQKNLIGRWFNLSYVTGANGVVLLQSLTRSAVSNAYDSATSNLIPVPIVTTYGYDPQNRVNRVNETGVADIAISYSSDGLTVIKTQGTGSPLPKKTETLTYDASGWLRSRQLRVSNNIDEEYQLLTSYAYDAAGRLIDVRPQSGGQTQYTYDTHGNQVTTAVYRSPVAWADPPPTSYENKTVTAYDRDNQVTNVTLGACSGTATCSGTLDGDASYSYQAVTHPTSYGYFVSVTIANQTFKGVGYTSQKTWVGSNWSGLQTSYDESGRMVQQSRDALNATSRVTTYAYKDGSKSNWISHGASDGSWPTEFVRSYGDQVATATSGGVEKDMGYDQYGNLAYLMEPLAYVGRWNGATPLTRMRETLSSFNGFGQQTFEYVVTNDGTAHDYNWNESKKYWQYYSTGELDYRWSGTPANIIDNQYATSGTNAGRLTTIVSGTGANGTVDTAHQTTALTYDELGRVATRSADTFTTTYFYDTLDRVIKTVLPNSGGSSMVWFDVSGGVKKQKQVDVTGRTDITTTAYDSLGRATTATFPDGSIVNTFYDPYGRPVKITDNRLTMNTSASDRSTYMKYDEFGRVVKKLGPVLVNNGQQYADARRPYAEYTYDNFGRQTSETRLISGGTVTPGTMAIPGGAVTATTSVTAYDFFDRPLTVVDPLGYTTTNAYDNNGSVVSRIQQKWKGGETDSATVGASGNPETVTTRTAFNSAGQPVLQMDARGNSRTAAYDILGNVAQQTDARGIVTKVNAYTADGLLESVWEPKLDGSAGPTSGDLSKFTPTEQYKYDDHRVYPSKVNRALMNSDAGAAPSSTTYVYDYAGRPKSITLPADQAGNTATLSKSYDSQGNVISETDVNGFTTTYSYDWAGRMTAKTEKVRGNAVDSAALPGGDLQSTYTYDASGNLTQKTERGLITGYQYNSLGKVIAETRPHTSSGSTYWKLNTYRLDGLKTAQTTYDYTGNLGTHPDVIKADDPNISVGPGNVNITLIEYNARGDQGTEISYTSGHNVESAWWQNVDGLGQRYRRVFTGWTGIYAPQRDTNGQLSGDANYLTYWKSDANGNLIEKWDTAAVANGSIWSARNSMDVQNDFKYTYSPSNKVLTENRTVEVKPGGTLLASSNASVTTTYNPRDLIATVNATEQLPVVSNTSGDPTGRSLTYSYYTNGAVSSINGTGGTRTSTYDARGRETTVVAPGGTTTTTYDPDGTQTDTVTGRPTGYSSNPNADITLYTSSSKPTVAGLVASSSTSTPPEGKVSSQSNTYNSAGQLTQNVTTSSSYQQASMTDTTTFAYNAYGQRLSGTAQASNSAGNYTSYAATYSDVAGNMTSETTGVRPASPLTSTFTLDSRGNRLATAGNGNYSGAVKRYNAEGQVAEITYASQVQSPDPHITSGTMYHYRYDPSGQRILFSHGGQISDGEGGSLLYRDENSTVSVGGQVQVTFRRAGDKGNFCSGEGGCKNHDSYSQNGYKFKDNTYSLAIGYNDPVSYDGVVPFALPKSRVRGLQAPVTALSNKLRINPLDVKPGAALPRLPDPAKVTQAGTDTSPATAPSGAQPAPAAPAASVQVGTGSPVLGVSGAGSSTTVSSVQPLNTQPVTASSPAAIRTSALPDPSKVQAPVTSTPGTASAMQNGTQNSSVGAAPVGSDSPRTVKSPGGQVIAAEVPDDFDDGTGFKYAVYAQDVRALAYEWNYNLSLVDNISAAYHQALESQKMSQGDKKRVDDARGAAYGALKSANQFTGQGKIPLWDLKFALDRVGELMVFGNVNPKDQVQFYNDLTSGIKGGSISQQDIIEIGKRSTAFEYQVGKTLEIASIRGHEMSELYQSYWDSQRIKDSVLAMPQFLKEYQQTDRSTGRVRFLDVHFANRNDGVTDYGFDLAMIIATGGEWLVAKSVARLGEMGTVRGLETLGTQGIERGGFDEAYSFGSNCFRKGFNSFTPSTSVRTLTGLVAIGALTVGTPVLAFNESTQQNGYYPITAVHRNLDPALTYLSLKDGRTGQPEAVTTTPEHPFYVQTQADTQTRPKPVGHEDLNSHWVGAGHLQIGDKIREADGSVGTVANVVTVQQTQEMFNLTVDTAHTFYVGDKGWLVHNGEACPTLLQLRAKQLAARNGSSDVTISTNNGAVRYDLNSDSHFNKVLNYDVPTPHSHTLVQNVNPRTGEVFLNPSKDRILDGYPSDISDLRLIDRYLKKQGK